MALTATATKSTRKCIVDTFNMKLPEVIYIPPAKNHIIYTVLDKPKDFSNYFEGIVEKLKVEGASMHRMIIFVKLTSMSSLFIRTSNINLVHT